MPPGQRPGRMKPPQRVSESAPDAGQGTLLAGRYRLAERLREDDGSAEWRATDEMLARTVVVRVLTPGSPYVAQVMAAAGAASRVSDPRLARIFDADDRVEPSFIVTGWPSDACLADVLTAGPLDPWLAARMIAEAADALEVAHQAGLAHLCLSPASVWCGPGGEVTITGLGILAALTGAQDGDPVLADTRGLARVLYAALTGFWPGEGSGALPPAPRPDGRTARPGQLRPGIPEGIDSVTCRALSGEAGEGGPPILSLAQLAIELAAAARPGPPSGSPPGPAPAPTLPSRTAWLPPRSRAVRRLTLLTAVVIVLAVLASGGWLAVREMTAPHGPSGAHPAVATQALIPASATAFGPLGESDGDNPEIARLAIDGSPATAWHTQWYATAAFGSLKPGTGLLLDMGRPVTITSAQIMLGAMTGAEVQLRAGDEPALADLRPVAQARAVGGVVTMRPGRPPKARYLLLWFTQLPPDSSGTFEALIYNVRLHGTAQ
jgi:hypothetical protein